MSSIKDNVLGCLQAFVALKDALRERDDTQFSPSLSDDQPSTLTLRQIQDEEARFKVWCGNIGAHQIGRRSLEYRLRDASHIRKQVIKLLSNLAESLEDARSLTSGEVTPLEEQNLDLEDDDDDDLLPGLEELGFDSEIAQVFSDIVDSTNCLLRLSMTIRNPAPHDRFLQAKATSTIHNEPWDIKHVQDKFPHAETDLTKRMGTALSRRRQYFKYRENHHNKLAHGIETDDGVGDVGKTQEAQSTVASSIPLHMKAPADRYGEAIAPDVLDEDRLSDSGASLTSYATSVSLADKLRVPRLPKEAENGPFECNFCYMIISAATQRAWKKHVYADLRPYVCLWKDCATPHQQYQRRSHWMNHVLQNHWRVWHCSLGCGAEFNSSADVKAHIGKSHPEVVASTSLDTLASLGEKPKPMDAPVECPLCHIRLSSIKEYGKHVGKHQAETALFALPRIETVEEDADEEVSLDSDATSLSERQVSDEENQDAVPEVKQESTQFDELDQPQPTQTQQPSSDVHKCEVDDCPRPRHKSNICRDPLCTMVDCSGVKEILFDLCFVHKCKRPTCKRLAAIPGDNCGEVGHACMEDGCMKTCLNLGAGLLDLCREHFLAFQQKYPEEARVTGMAQRADELIKQIRTSQDAKTTVSGDEKYASAKGAFTLMPDDNARLGDVNEGITEEAAGRHDRSPRQTSTRENEKGDGTAHDMLTLHLHMIETGFITEIKPLAMEFIETPPSDIEKLRLNHRKVRNKITETTLSELDTIKIPRGSALWERRQQLARNIQQLLMQLDNVLETAQDKGRRPAENSSNAAPPGSAPTEPVLSAFIRKILGIGPKAAESPAEESTQDSAEPAAPSDTYSRSDRKVVPGLPRAPTFRRQQSEMRARMIKREEVTEPAPSYEIEGSSDRTAQRNQRKRAGSEDTFNRLPYVDQNTDEDLEVSFLSRRPAGQGDEPSRKDKPDASDLLKERDSFAAKLRESNRRRRSHASSLGKRMASKAADSDEAEYASHDDADVVDSWSTRLQASPYSPPWSPVSEEQQPWRPMPEEQQERQRLQQRWELSSSKSAFGDGSIRVEGGYCPHCGVWIRRKDNLIRHIHEMHGRERRQQPVSASTSDTPAHSGQNTAGDPFYREEPRKDNKDASEKKPAPLIEGIPESSRWTEIARRLVDPQLLIDAGEKFIVRGRYFVIQRLMTMEEIHGYIKASESKWGLSEARFEDQAGMPSMRRRVYELEPPAPEGLYLPNAGGEASNSRQINPGGHGVSDDEPSYSYSELEQRLQQKYLRQASGEASPRTAEALRKVPRRKTRTVSSDGSAENEERDVTVHVKKGETIIIDGAEIKTQGGATITINRSHSPRRGNERDRDRVTTQRDQLRYRLDGSSGRPQRENQYHRQRLVVYDTRSEYQARERPRRNSDSTMTVKGQTRRTSPPRGNPGIIIPASPTDYFTPTYDPYHTLPYAEYDSQFQTVPYPPLQPPLQSERTRDIEREQRFRERFDRADKADRSTVAVPTNQRNRRENTSSARPAVVVIDRPPPPQDEDLRSRLVTRRSEDPIPRPRRGETTKPPIEAQPAVSVHTYRKGKDTAAPRGQPLVYSADEATPPPTGPKRRSQPADSPNLPEKE